MKRNTKGIIFSAIALMAITSCGQQPAQSKSSSVKLPEMDSDVANAIISKLGIKDAKAIYGNIYLPTEIDGATITWESSDTEVITDKEVDGKAPGVVTRFGDDQNVTLKATIEKDGLYAFHEQEVCVKALENYIDDDSYEGYLFGHFIGEGGANEEQIYFALAEEGLKFKDMNGGKPVLTSDVGEKGVRDPYICRSPEGDRFFLIATDLSIYHRGGWSINAQGYYDPSTTGSHNLVLWQSNDLINWGSPKLLPVAPENAGMAWAPEMIYDEEVGQYIIFFASSIMDTETKMKAKPNAIYYVATRDFEHFSDTEILIDNQDDPDRKAREIIDSTIIKIDDMYYSASKDGDNKEANGGIRIMKTDNLLDKDSWEKVLDLDELGLNMSGQRISELTNGTLEGPEFFLYNKKDWADEHTPEYGLMADQYSVSAGYLPLKTTDVEDKTNKNDSWKILSSSEYSFDRLKKRHGTILKVTADEIERLKEAYSA